MSSNHDLDELPIHCPFCGTADLLGMQDEDTFFILCMECRTCGPVADSDEEAMLAWCERVDTSDHRTIYTRTAKRRVAFLG